MQCNTQLTIQYSKWVAGNVNLVISCSRVSVRQMLSSLQKVMTLVTVLQEPELHMSVVGPGLVPRDDLHGDTAATLNKHLLST